jgi:hypothetical protein
MLPSHVMFGEQKKFRITSIVSIYSLEANLHLFHNPSFSMFLFVSYIQVIEKRGEDICASFVAI